MRLSILAIVLVSSAIVSSAVAHAAPVAGFTQTNLVSDLPNTAASLDPDLKNPWGIAFSSTSPFWVADNATSVSTLYDSAGTKQGLTVTTPPQPTGIVFNSTPSFNGDLSILATENGVIAGWRPALGTTTEALSITPAGAVYKGLAIGTTTGGTYLYAADFRGGQIIVTPGTGAPGLPGNFTDPTLPSGFAPFNIRNIGNQLYVTYARQDAALHDDVPGAGNGFVNVFNLDGTFVKRLISNGVLNSPWGFALAPAGFGTLGGDFLVGNFSDGTINAFTAAGTFSGTLADTSGAVLVNDGSWAVTFGNGGNGGNLGSLYLTPGLTDEADGLFARIDGPVPEPSSLLLITAGLAPLGRGTWRRLRSRREHPAP